MFLNVPLVAQKKQYTTLHWQIAGIIPADSNQQLSLGFAGPVTGMHNKVFFIAGGANFPHDMPWQGGKKAFYKKVYVYSRKKYKLVPFKKSFILPEAIAYSACVTTPIGVVYAGGETNDGFSNKVWLLQWEAMNQNLVFKSLPNLPAPLSNAAATVVGNTVYIAGGETAFAASSQLLALDLDNAGSGWKDLAPVPQPVSHTVLAASGGKAGSKIYLIGGRKKNSNGISSLYSNVFVYDVTNNSWEEKAPLPYALSAGTGALLKAGNIIIFGGDKGTVFNNVETMIASINAEKDEIKKQAIILQKNQLQSEHPGFSKELLQYNMLTDTWKPIGEIPFETPVTTTAVKWGNQIIIPSGEIKAGVRSPNILSATILNKEK